ncbi:thiol:disulfide oxidoreductase [Aggregicoccus sp. 17bor-14]|uniref:glutathione S-transferase N-terminal domain-containing protein n=1 Tax=Myxococcaceae TaxID=31 RepID=UPI00129CBE3D|nr:MULTISPECIES: glutathione S-transferase N-terminal domain-containing protein [Myxococcaceae]MBF5041904.1 glutathione S-transferase N-terminal domain-containing protein [Simulacricoccus sp. 17bor-14]MRI87685.1 thiol:disulfide oxidoreductase [Aggregicoccus sp. 17bor-14]
MLDVYYWPTPNGHKVTMFLEEAGLPYRLVPVDIGAGAQFAPEFLRISPNNKMPALVDPEPAGGGGPLSVFESGAILLYLAEKTGRFLPREPRARMQTLEWLFWQVAGFGPMLGQNHHFNRYAPEKIPYAIERYVKETSRLYAVLDRRLEGRDFIAGEYSIADMAAYPWVVPHEAQQQSLERFPHVKRWFEAIRERPATKRAYAKGEGFGQPGGLMTPEAKKILFGQSADTLKK